MHIYAILRISRIVGFICYVNGHKITVVIVCDTRHLFRVGAFFRELIQIIAGPAELDFHRGHAALLRVAVPLRRLKISHRNLSIGAVYFYLMVFCCGRFRHRHVLRRNGLAAGAGAFVGVVKTSHRRQLVLHVPQSTRKFPGMVGREDFAHGQGGFVTGNRLTRVHSRSPCAAWDCRAQSQTDGQQACPYSV